MRTSLGQPGGGIDRVFMLYQVGIYSSSISCESVLSICPCRPVLYPLGITMHAINRTRSVSEDQSSEQPQDILTLLGPQSRFGDKVLGI